MRVLLPAGLSAFQTGLVAYSPLNAEKLAPTLHAAQTVGIRDVVCVDGVLSAAVIEGIQERADAKNLNLSSIHPEALHHSLLPPVFRQKPLWGVFAAHEVGVEGAAAFSRFLKDQGRLANPDSARSEEAVRILRRKEAFRNHIYQGSLASRSDLKKVWHRVVPVKELSVETLRKALAPDFVVVKPKNSSGSKGVQLIDLKEPKADFKLSRVGEELRYLAKNNVTARSIDVEEVQVEEFVAGEEYSVEGYVKGGEVLISAIHWKPDMYLDFLKQEQFIEGRFISLPSTAPEYGALASLNEAILRSIPGFGESVFHAEYRYNPETGFVFPLEIAGRIGGGSLAESSALVSGVNLYEAGVRLAAGLPMSRPQALGRLTSEATIFPSQDGLLRGMRLHLPQEPSIDLFETGEEEVTHHINVWLRRVSRDLAVRTFDTFETDVPFSAPFRRRILQSLKREGDGLDVQVAHFRNWAYPGMPIYGFVGLHLGGILLASASSLADFSTLADVMAAMRLLLSSFESEVEPFSESPVL